MARKKLISDLEGVSVRLSRITDDLLSCEQRARKGDKREIRHIALKATEYASALERIALLTK